MTEGTDQQTSYEETISFKSDPKSIELCTKGLVEKFNSPVQGIDAALEVVNNRSISIQDKLIGENEKFEKVAEEYKMQEMIQKTRQYHQKLTNLQKEMLSLGDRSNQMKSRALKLQEAKQKEALKRELKRQDDFDREEALVAKPVSK